MQGPGICAPVSRAGSERCDAAFRGKTPRSHDVRRPRYIRRARQNCACFRLRNGGRRAARSSSRRSAAGNPSSRVPPLVSMPQPRCQLLCFQSGAIVSHDAIVVNRKTLIHAKRNQLLFAAAKDAGTKGARCSAFCVLRTGASGHRAPFANADDVSRASRRPHDELPIQCPVPLDFLCRSFSTASPRARLLLRIERIFE